MQKGVIIMALSNAGTKTILELLSGAVFYIPNYQRDYSWGREELDDFWDDLIETIDSADLGDHFFGQILVHNSEDNNKKYIIDGQQRTITSVIFLSVLRKHFGILYSDDNSLDDANEDKTEITVMCIGRKDKYKLVLGDSDKDYFIDNIQAGTPNSKKPTKKSQQNIFAAFNYFDKKVEDHLKKESDNFHKYQSLNDLYKTFADHFVVLYLEETKIEQAFVIFETLNARGKDLETADLLKNYFFSKNPSNIDVSQRKWDNMIRDLGNEDPTKYIRHYWNSRHALTREKELYRTINDSITNKKESKELLDDLSNLAKLYHDIADPYEATMFSNDSLISSLRVLKDLKAKSFYPIFLALGSSDKFDHKDYARVASKIETYVFRNATICGRTANTTEKFFSKIANDIYGEELETTTEICDAISENIVSDEEFGAIFSNITFSEKDKPIIRYIFRKIHKHLDAGSELNIDNMEVHIEHIMPETIGSWDIDEDTHNQYLWRLGNLMLLQGKLNISIHNDLFDSKKAEYKKSKIEPNHDLLSYTEWTPKEIEDRQKTLTQYALKIWSK